MATVVNIIHLHDLVVLFLDTDVRATGGTVLVNNEEYDAIWPSSGGPLLDSVAVRPGFRPDSFFMGGVVEPVVR